MEVIAIGKVFLFALFSFLLLLLDLAISYNASLPLPLCLGALIALLLLLALTLQNINRYLPTKAGPLSKESKNVQPVQTNLGYFNPPIKNNLKDILAIKHIQRFLTNLYQYKNGCVSLYIKLLIVLIQPGQKSRKCKSISSCQIRKQQQIF